MLDTLVYVEGRKGEGKSTLMRAIVLEHAREGHPFLVWDSTREWSRVPGVEVYSAADHGVEEIAALAIERRATLVVDEVDRVLKKRLGDLAGPYPNLHGIIHYGRHLETALLCASRRPANVHNDLLELADVVFLLYHSGVASCAWIKEQFDQETADRVRQLQQGEWVRVDM